MKPLIVIITGLSGSGKTVALRSLEDAGFFCVDNLPPQLIDPFATIMERANRTRFAIGIDVREKDLIPVVDETLASLRKKYTIEIIFLESDRESLIRRYKETRRPHPLAAPGGPGIEEAIAQEAELLGALRAEASRIIDTSSFTPHQLRHLMASIYGGREDVMNVTLLSFGYKYGIPLNADLLFDIRFIPNPHFVPALRELTGLDPEVMKFVLESPGTEDFLKRLMDFLAYLIPLYQKEGKAYLTIGIGCTGGRHRSPAVVDKIAPLVRKSVPVDVVHRDL
ncbi:MAG: RNase adapter RapZ [Nitrospirota bacterium]